MRIMRRRLSFVLFLVIILLLAFVSVSAEYPEDKTIRLVVPFGAGGGVDTCSRILSTSAQALIDQRIDVISMPGAGGQEAVSFVMNQPKDGYTFLVTDNGPIIVGPLTEKMPYKPEDWKPVVQITEAVPTFFVREDSPIKDIDDWIDKAKAEPNRFTVAHGRYLSLPHIPLIMFEKMAGIENKGVPTTGGAEALLFVLGGHCDIGASVPSTIGQSVQAGKLRALAVCSEERVPSLPDTPTMKELGYDIVFPGWYTVFAYKGVPEDRIEFIEGKFIEALNTTGAKRVAGKLNVPLTPYGSEQSQVIFERTIEDLKKILAEEGKLLEQ